MVKIEINGLEFLVKPNLSVLEACKYVGIIIPRFCYHETLSVSGNCRMCLIEIGNSPKPQASCALPILNGMKIFIQTPLVKKARENVLETLLLNHPLDCPICDQGGECDLQDQTKLFGNDYSRFFYNKRAVEDKNCGALINTIMTRCIHCTRCVRFSSEIAGVDFFGTLNRGGATEIGNYSVNKFASEISGNVIDLCPVGALTSKGYAFKARPWELKATESIDLTDSTGSNIYVNFKETDIIKIIPKINFEINNDIISDKARFSFDNYKTKRLQQAFQAIKNDIFKTLNWTAFLKEVNSFKNTKLTFLINDELDLESLNLLNQLSYKTNNQIIIKTINKASSIQNLNVTQLTNKISELKSDSKFCFIISSNIRIENAIINMKLRLKFLNNNVLLYSLNKKINSTFSLSVINLTLLKLITFLEGKNLYLSKMLLNFKSPIICLGNSFIKYGFNLTNSIITLKKIIPSSKILNISLSCNSEGLKLFDFKSITNKQIKTSDHIFAINLSDNLLISKLLNKINNIIWCNTHGSMLALNSNKIIPILSSFEEEQIFLNLEQRPQKTFKVFSNFSKVKSFKQFIEIFTLQKSQNISKFLIELIKNKNKFKTMCLNLTNLDKLNFKTLLPFNKIKTQSLTKTLEDFYLTNNNTKNSLTMLKLSTEYKLYKTNFN